MKVIWYPSPNYSGNREKISYLIIHWFGTGNIEGAKNRFLNPSSKVSAHYAISGKTIYQFVKEGDTAYHAGNLAMNLRSIGIEHDATLDHNASEETYQTSGQLVKEICQKWNIPLDREHIIGHRQVVATQCPGTLDIDKIINIAKGESMELFNKNAYSLGVTGKRYFHLTYEEATALKAVPLQEFKLYSDDWLIKDGNVYQHVESPGALNEITGNKTPKYEVVVFKEDYDSLDKQLKDCQANQGQAVEGFITKILNAIKEWLSSLKNK